MRVKDVAAAESMIDLSGRGAPQEFQRFAWVQPSQLPTLCIDFKRMYFSFVVQNLQDVILQFPAQIEQQAAAAVSSSQAPDPQHMLPTPASRDTQCEATVQESVDALVARFGKAAVLGCLLGDTGIEAVAPDLPKNHGGDVEISSTA
jgi:hypothetical protein